jgi:hypothetical protein
MIDKESLKKFQEQNTSLFDECRELLESFEEEEADAKAIFEEFEKKIGVLSENAKNVSFKEVSLVSDLSRLIARKAIASTDKNLHELTVGVFFDALDLIDDMIKGGAEGREVKVETFITRLKWLAAKYIEVEKLTAPKPKPKGPAETSPELAAIIAASKKKK